METRVISLALNASETSVTEEALYLLLGDTEDSAKREKIKSLLSSIYRKRKGLNLQTIQHEGA